MTFLGNPRPCHVEIPKMTSVMAPVLKHRFYKVELYVFCQNRVGNSHFAVRGTPEFPESPTGEMVRSRNLTGEIHSQV